MCDVEHVFKEQRGEGESRHSAVHLDASGRLVVTIHDLGGIFDEYESVETYSIEQTQRLRTELGDDLIATIAERFPTKAAFSDYLRQAGIRRGEVWNSIH